MEFDNTIGERIKKRRKELKITQSLIHEATGISSGNLSGIESGKNLPSSAALVQLSTILQCSIDWILTGKEYNTSSNIRDFEDQVFLNNFYSLSDADQEKIRHFIDIANIHTKSYITPVGYEATPTACYMVAEEAKYGMKSIPVRGYVAAGKPIMAIDNHFDDIEVSNSKIDYALIVNGNSMDPLIKDGAYVYVQNCEQLENGEIGVFLINNDVTCKKFFQNDVMIKLISINPAYEDMVFMLDDPQNRYLNFKIEGRVIL